VAARTYALSQRRPAAPYDVKATVASQVYKGVEAETPSTREAVAATRAQVLVYGSNLIQAVFHSSGGGATENSGDLWSRQLPYLVSVPDYDQAGPVARWEQRFDGAELRRLFPELGGITAVQVLASTSSGRVRQVRLQGPAGSLVLAGQELRSRLKLRSTLVQFRFELPSLTALTPAPTPSLGQPPISPTPLAPGAVDPQATPSAGLAALPPLPALDSPPVPLPAEKLQPVLVVSGRGFGHGVGMSQWGAYAMALAGEDYTRILSHYYRGTALRPYPLP
jgi:stage II sporulation protein D